MWAIDRWGMKWWSGAAVLTLHAIVLLVLLWQDHLKTQSPTSRVETHWINLTSEKPASTFRAIAPPVPRNALPPAIDLSPPQFTILAPETPRSSPITVLPGDKALLPQGSRDYNDLFPADKKEQLKNFFTEQALIDRRENAQARNGKSPCDIFKKPDDLGAAGDLPNNGVTKNFKPGFTIGTGGSDDDRLSVHPCN